MFTITESATIARARSDVFAFFADPANRSRWDSTVISERLTSPGPIAVDSTIHTRMRVMGRESDFEWRVTAFTPPQRMAIVSTSGLLPTSLVFDFVEVPDGCRASATIEGRPTGMLAFVEPMIAEAVRSTLATGLQKAAAILQAEGDAPSQG